MNEKSVYYSTSMSKLIVANNIIKQAKKKGVDFGKGNPYNRLRYYTKIGWLPHMTRQKDKKGSVVGHYPAWVVSRLEYIQGLKDKGLTNEEITEKIETQNVKQSVSSAFNFLKNAEQRNQLIAYITLLMLAAVLLIETGAIPLGTTKRDLIQDAKQVGIQKQILDSGGAFVQKNEKLLFIKSKNITTTSKVNITFEENYSPANKYWVAKKVPNEGFYLELDLPTAQDATFNWWITQ
jgi:DNA-binding transcriptional MerR regulator